jgi:transcriptional regulator
MERVMAFSNLAFYSFVAHTSPKGFMGDKHGLRGDLVQGTLDMLVLKALTRGAMHGYAIVEFIQQSSDDVLRVEEGALYPALHRLELRGLLSAHWGVSENNRRAKYYALTAVGRKYLAEESSNWRRLSGAVSRVIEMA